MASIALPNPSEPLVDPETGRITDVWYRYLFKNVSEVTTIELTATAPLSISSSNVISFGSTFTYADQSTQEAAASSTAIVTPSVQQYHPSAAKAWGCVTLAGTVATLNAGYNVNTVASTAVGLLRVDLATPFSSTSYVVVPGITNTDIAAAVNLTVSLLSSVGRATTSFTLISELSNGNNTDPIGYNFVCYGDQ